MILSGADKEEINKDYLLYSSIFTTRESGDFAERED